VIRAALPVLSRGIGEWPLILTAMGTACTMYAIDPFFPTLPWMLAMSFVLGLGLGISQPMVLSVLHRAAPPDRIGEASGLRMMLVNITQTVLPTGFGAVGGAVGLGPLFWGMAALVGVGAIYGGPWRAPSPQPGTSDGHRNGMSIVSVTDDAALRVPATLRELFLAFSGLALRGFGGVLPLGPARDRRGEALADPRAVRRDARVRPVASRTQRLQPGDHGRPSLLRLAWCRGGAGRHAVRSVRDRDDDRDRLFPCRRPSRGRGAVAGMGAVSAGLILATAVKLGAGLREWRGGLLSCSGCVPDGGGVALAAAAGAGGIGDRGDRRRVATGPSMTVMDFVDLFLHFALLSLLSVGGALATSPEMHRFLVDGRGWLDHRQFTDAIALAQAAPGPNILFVTLLGWQTAGWQGALVTTSGHPAAVQPDHLCRQPPQRRP
jgi:hypothetical protein